MLNRNQAMAEHVNASLALLQDDVANQGLVFTVGGFHFDKSDFVEDWREAFDRQTDSLRLSKSPGSF
jgi:hypothetical protein